MHKRNSKTDFNNKYEHEKIVCHNGPNKYKWKSTRLQPKNNKPMLNISPHVTFPLNKTVKLASKEPTFKQLKMSTRKMADLLKENTLKGITCTYSNCITEIPF